MGSRRTSAWSSQACRNWLRARRSRRSHNNPNPKSRVTMFVDTFIQRPILATVCSLVIILAGAMVIPTLPVAYYPELAPPTVRVTAIYTGANAESVETGVTTPIEQAINGVEGMTYMT